MRGQEQEQVNGEKGEIAVVATILYDWLKEVSWLQPHLSPLRSFRLGNSFHLRPSPSASIICLAFALLFGRYTFALLLRSLLSLELHADIHRGVDVMGNVTSGSAQLPVTVHSLSFHPHATNDSHLRLHFPAPAYVCPGPAPVWWGELAVHWQK